jgi:DNA-binding protein Fis
MNKSEKDCRAILSQNIKDDVSAAIAKYLDDVDGVLVKSIEEAVRPAVKKTIKKMLRYFTHDNKE